MGAEELAFGIIKCWGEGGFNNDQKLENAKKLFTDDMVFDCVALRT